MIPSRVKTKADLEDWCKVFWEAGDGALYHPIAIERHLAYLSGIFSAYLSLWDKLSEKNRQLIREECDLIISYEAKHTKRSSVLTDEEIDRDLEHGDLSWA